MKAELYDTAYADLSTTEALKVEFDAFIQAYQDDKPIKQEANKQK